MKDPCNILDVLHHNPGLHHLRPDFFDLVLEDGDARHEHGRGLLIEARRDAQRACLDVVARDAGDVQALGAAQVLVVSDVLDELTRARLERLAGESGNLEVDGLGSARGNAVDLPGRSLANTDLSLADARVLLGRRDAVPNHVGDLELDVESRIGAHVEVVLRVLVEHAEIALFDRCRE